MTSGTAGPSPRRALLLRIAPESGPVTRFWMGFGDLELPDDAPVDPGGLYRGMGVLQDTPPLRQLSGGRAERVDFRFIETHPDVVAMMETEVLGAEVRIAVVSFDAAQAVISVKWLWRGVYDVSAIELSDAHWTRVLSAISGVATRMRAELLYWSNAAHQSVHPGDRFFDQVQGMTVNKVIPWATG